MPTNHVCMDYEPFKVSYTAGQPYVGATLSMYPPKGENNLGNFIAWDAGTGKIVWSDPGAVLGVVGRAGDGRRRRVLRHARRLSEGRSTPRPARSSISYKTPSGIIGNVNTYEHKRQAIHRGAFGRRRLGRHRHGGRAGNDTDGLGAVGAYKQLSNYTQLGGVMTVFGVE